MQALLTVIKELSAVLREFGMTAMMSGVALHGGFLPYCGTFLIFMEYARNAVRMACVGLA